MSEQQEGPHLLGGNVSLLQKCWPRQIQQKAEPVQMKASQSCLVVSWANYRFVEGADRRLLVRNPPLLHLCGDVTTMAGAGWGGGGGLLCNVNAACKRCCCLAPPQEINHVSAKKNDIFITAIIMLSITLRLLTYFLSASDGAYPSSCWTGTHCRYVTSPSQVICTPSTHTQVEPREQGFFHEWLWLLSVTALFLLPEHAVILYQWSSAEDAEKR